MLIMPITNKWLHFSGWGGNHEVYSDKLDGFVLEASQWVMSTKQKQQIK